jgi:hypothetical protein
MKIPASIVPMTLVGSLALANERSGQTQMPPIAANNGDSQTVSPAQSSRTPTRRSDSSDCPSVTEVVWFAQTPRIVYCATIPGFGELLKAIVWHSADVNADGDTEYLAVAPQNSSTGGYLTFNGSPSQQASNLALFRQFTNAQQQMQLHLVRIFATDFDLHQWFAAQFPDAPPSVYLSYDMVGSNPWGGWRDMDHDGDLDLLLTAQGTSGSAWFRQIWLENIGYEKPAPPLAADINRDGRVDGADLGLVLVSWGTNP